MERLENGLYRNSDGEVVNKHGEQIATWSGSGGFHTSAREDALIGRIIIGVCIASPILIILMFMG